MAVKVSPELVTSGPYQFIRHPIYSGLLMAALGTALVVSYFWLVLLVVSGFYFIYSAIMEEKEMIKTFPNQYPDYKKTTKMLVPYIF